MSRRGQGHSVDAAPRFARFAPADGITLGTAVCGLLVIAVAERTPPDEGLRGSRLALAGGLLLAATVLDVADGWVARRLGGSALGIHLDLLADAVTFAAAPAALLVATGGDGGAGARAAAIAAGVVYLAAALVRLARFARDRADQSAETFCGLPSPMGAVGILAIVVIRPPPAVALAVAALLAAMMLSRIRTPKLRRPLTVSLAGAWLTLGILSLAGILPLRVMGVLSLGVAFSLPLVGGVRRRARASH